MRTVFSAVCCLAFAGEAVLAQSAPSASAEESSALPAPTLRLSPRLRAPAQAAGELPTFLEGDQATGQTAGLVVLTGEAQVRRRDAVLKAERIDYDQASGQLDAQGNARLLREANLVTGPQMRYNLQTDTGSVESPQFWLGAHGGSGRAESAEIFSRSRMRLTKVMYVGCDCPEPAWEIRASKLDLDSQANEGVARNGVLFFKGVPILASPYLAFPLRDERKSGLLLPTYGTTSNSGFEISTPYYLNLAPHYDATITPRYLSKRGTQTAAEFRYLSRRFEGEVSGTYLSRDRQMGEKRWLYSARHRHQLGSGFSAGWNVAGVSDDDYFRDFSTLGLNEASTTYLTRQGYLNWSSRYARAMVRLYRTQSLFEADALSRAPQYDKMPEVSMQAARYNWRGFDAVLEGEATWFRPQIGEQRIGGVWQDKRFGPDGQRFSLYPSLAYPIVRPGWHITPKFGVHLSRYQTAWHAGDARNTAGYNSQYSTLYGSPRSGGRNRVQPIFSVDAGLTFERAARFFGKPITQTLEPRLYYLRVPYREQSALPVYDTSLSDFSFSQAFQENTYTGGWDRIANANQLTLSLSTQFRDPASGFQRANLAVAQRLYFEDQRVTLLNEVPRTGGRSEYLLHASAALTDTFSTQASLQYNDYESQWDRAMLGLRWQPQRLASVSASYRYQRDALTATKTLVPYAPRGQHQVSLAFQWPLAQRWYALGRVDYSLRRSTITGIRERRRVTQAIAGLEYKGECCWSARAVFQRYAIDAKKSNTAFFFQLELHGLGKLGTDPMRLLARSIPGYQDITPPSRPLTTFERYE